ncbi:hypothetical protein Tco_0867449 [Tanacetum coccineum]
MTTTVVSNLVFMGFFKKQKLIEPNFIDWYRQLRIVLSSEDKLNYLEHPIPVALVSAFAGQQVPLEALAAHAAWVKGQKEIAILILKTMEPDIQQNLENLCAYDMLQELKTLFSQQAEQELLQTVREFHACKQEEGQSVSSYVLNMKSYIDNLERLGHPVSLNLAVSLILVSLRKGYDSFMQNYNMHGMGKTVNKLHAMLKLHEQTLPKKYAPALHAIRSGKSAARILNMVPTKKVEKTSYEVWHGKAPKMSYLKVWGYEALVKRDTLTKPDKRRSIKYIFVGYPKEIMGYSFYYPPENKIFVAWNAEFLEDDLITQESSGSLEDLEIIQEEDIDIPITNPYHNTISKPNKLYKLK